MSNILDMNSDCRQLRSVSTHLDVGAVGVDPAHPADGLEGEVMVGVEVVRLNDVAVPRALDAYTGFHWTKSGHLLALSANLLHTHV